MGPVRREHTRGGIRTPASVTRRGRVRPRQLQRARPGTGDRAGWCGPGGPARAAAKRPIHQDATLDQVEFRGTGKLRSRPQGHRRNMGNRTVTGLQISGSSGRAFEPCVSWSPVQTRDFGSTVVREPVGCRASGRRSCLPGQVHRVAHGCRPWWQGETCQPPVASEPAATGCRVAGCAVAGPGPLRWRGPEPGRWAAGRQGEEAGAVRAALAQQLGGIGSVKLGELPDPVAAAGQALVRVHGVGVGPWDVGFLGWRQPTVWPRCPARRASTRRPGL